MKKAGLIACTVVSLFALVGSSIWEGAAGIAPGGILPGSGLYIATNSFPINTVVDVTNLATGQTTRVVTSAPLETTPGLLAVLSIDAAEAIGLPGRSLGRVRMSQPPEPVAFSRFGERRGRGRGPEGRGDAESVDFFGPRRQGPGARNDDAIVDLPRAAGAAPFAFHEEAPDLAPRVEEAAFAAAAEPAILAAVPSAEDPAAAEALAENAFAEEEAVLAAAALETPGDDDAFLHDAVSLMQDHFHEDTYVIVDDFFAADAVAGEQADTEAAFAAHDYLLSLVPAEYRPAAEEGFAPDPDYVIAAISPVQAAEFLDGIDPAMLIGPPETAPHPHAFAPPLAFPVTMISRLQAGKYYLQIAAYTNAEAVQYELLRLERIDSSLTREVVVKRGENPEHGTVYQVLIGPLNLGESGALLQRFRSTTHRDAFIRSGG